MSAPVRLCRDCEHKTFFDTCARVVVRKSDPVDGELMEQAGVRCRAERGSNRSIWGRVKCGPKGKFFLPRQPEPTFDEALAQAVERQKA